MYNKKEIGQIKCSVGNVCRLGEETKKSFEAFLKGLKRLATGLGENDYVDDFDGQVQEAFVNYMADFKRFANYCLKIREVFGNDFADALDIDELSDTINNIEAVSKDYHHAEKLVYDLLKTFEQFYFDNFSDRLVALIGEFEKFCGHEIVKEYLGEEDEAENTEDTAKENPEPAKTEDVPTKSETKETESKAVQGHGAYQVIKAEIKVYDKDRADKIADFLNRNIGAILKDGGTFRMEINGKF